MCTPEYDVGFVLVFSVRPYRTLCFARRRAGRRRSGLAVRSIAIATVYRVPYQTTNTHVRSSEVRAHSTRALKLPLQAPADATHTVFFFAAVLLEAPPGSWGVTCVCVVGARRASAVAATIPCGCVGVTWCGACGGGAKKLSLASSAALRILKKLSLTA